MNTDVTRVVKAIAAVLVLSILVILVFGWWGDYRRAQPEESPETTSTATPTVDATKTPAGEATAPAKTTTVVVLIEGLNMREEPAPDGTRIRGLKKGDKLVLIKTQDSWYQVRAADKKVGWISANPQYTKLEE